MEAAVFGGVAVGSVLLGDVLAERVLVRNSVAEALVSPRLLAPLAPVACLLAPVAVARHVVRLVVAHLAGPDPR